MARLSGRSLRLRAQLVTIAVAVAPVLFVAASDLSDREVGSAMLARVQHVANAVAEGERDIDGLARAQGVWVRVVHPDGSVDEHDHAYVQGVADALFFGEDGAASLRQWDASQPGPAAQFGALAVGGTTSGCERVDKGRLLVCTAAVRTDTALLVVQDSSRRAIRAFYDPRYQLGRLTLFAAAVGIGMGAWLGWRLVRPVESLRNQVLARVGRADASPVELARDDEIGDLARAFNQLLATLDDRRRANETFAADLVHELKNPIAAVRTAADLMAGSADEVRRARIETILRDASGRLDRLVSAFLELARAEAGLAADAREEVDLRELAEGIASQWDEVEVVGAGRALVVPERMETALRNLVENAVAFARLGPEPHVTVRIDGGTLVVEDNGPGIPPEDLPRVFERFFTRRRQGGTGLGLPLARAIVEAHGGRISAANRPEGGARLVIELPD